MIEPEQLKPFFPAFLWDNPSHRKYMVKEYIQLLILDYLTTTAYVKKIIFIGGTNLRLIKGIDRFSEDLDFDCKDLSDDEFIAMTNGVVEFLKRMGLRVETRDKRNDKLIAYRRNLIKIESQDQQVVYNHKMGTVKGCGLYFTFPVPADDVLCAMKLSALLSRQKGRDFYDVMFLLAQTAPNFDFLEKQCGIGNMQELKQSLFNMLESVDLEHKSKDFQHLVFQQTSTKKIIHFTEFITEMQ